MNKLRMGALALVLATALTGCSKAAPSPGATGSSADDSTTTSSATTPTSTPTTAGPADQSTPEAAMTSWLNAMVSGDGNSVCTIMAAGGKPISSIPGASDACGKTITPMLDSLKQLGSAFKGLSITGATVNGKEASFESVTTEPALAADVVSSFKAVKIGAKWYITQ